jgi:hypothetical protein
MKKQKKYHYIYKTICNMTGKYYIGMHSTDDLDDGYLGSGKRLWNSINYYGKGNHRKEILEFLNNRTELKTREIEIVNEQLLSDVFCMNIALGGGGGFISEEHHLKMRKGASVKNKVMMKEFWSDPEKKKIRSENISKIILNLNDDKKNRMKNGSIWWVGKKHSNESKLKMVESSKGRGLGMNNSQYGTCWITDGFVNKKIKKDDIIPQGWVLGRKL